MEVKLFEQDGELYVLAKSEGRRTKEKAIRRKRLARLTWKLRAMRQSLPPRDTLFMCFEQSKAKLAVPMASCTSKCRPKTSPSPVKASNRVNKKKLQEAELRDGHYLLRSNLSATDPSLLWALYVQLTQIETHPLESLDLAETSSTRCIAVCSSSNTDSVLRHAACC